MEELDSRPSRGPRPAILAPKSPTVRLLEAICRWYLRTHAPWGAVEFPILFLKAALSSNVHKALVRLGGSRGFTEVRSRGAKGNIEIELKFRERHDSPLVTYSLSIGERDGSPVVESEVLKYRRGSSGRPWHFLNFSLGSGYAVTNELDAVTDVTQLET